MNLLLSCIGRRGYIADYFRPHLSTGDRIIGTSHTPWTVGLAACDDAIILPPIDSDGYLAAVLAACEQHAVGAILSFYDPDVALLSHNRDLLDAIGCTAFVAGERTTTIAYDKWNTFTALSALGYAVPHTEPGLEQAIDALETGRLAFPLVVKPRRGFGSLNTFIARDIEQLRAFVRCAPDMLVQQYIEGTELNASVLADLESQPLAAVPCRKYLMAGGETQHAATIEHPGMLELACRIARDILLVGPLDIDVIEARDGTLFVLDLNPRFGGGYPVAHLAGADFPGLIIEMARGGSPSPRIGAYQRDIYMMKAISILGGELRALGSEACR